MPSKRKIKSSRTTNTRSATSAKAGKKPSVSVVEESPVAYKHTTGSITKIRSIGNSKGIILNQRVMQDAGLESQTSFVITAKKGIITLRAAPDQISVNTDLTSWDAQFKQAIAHGRRPESAGWENLSNVFDETEWA